MLHIRHVNVISFNVARADINNDIFVECVSGMNERGWVKCAQKFMIISNHDMIAALSLRVFHLKLGSVYAT